MTAPSEGAPARPGRRGTLLKAALVLSLVLNICFVGGLAYSRFFAQPNQPLLEIARQLDLSPDQRAVFRDFVQTMRSKGPALRDTNAKLSAEVWAELQKPDPDIDAITRSFAQIADNRREFQTAMVRALIPFLAKLSPEQRKQFIELMRRRQEGVAARVHRFLGP